MIKARWRSGNAAVCKTAIAPVQFWHAPQKKGRHDGNARVLNPDKYCWRRVGVVDRAGLENQYGFTVIGGSNPSASAFIGTTPVLSAF